MCYLEFLHLSFCCFFSHFRLSIWCVIQVFFLFDFHMICDLWSDFFLQFLPFLKEVDCKEVESCIGGISNWWCFYYLTKKNGKRSQIHQTSNTKCRKLIKDHPKCRRRFIDHTTCRRLIMDHPKYRRQIIDRTTCRRLIMDHPKCRRWIIDRTTCRRLIMDHPNCRRRVLDHTNFRRTHHKSHFAGCLLCPRN